MHVEEKQACESVVEGSRDIQQHRRREPQYRDAGERWWRRARRRCMKAKALQTIVTLYMTSSCYNNTAVIYCTVQVRLNIWLDKADHSLQQQFCPDSVCVCLFFSIFSYHSSYLFLLFNSTRVCIYTYLKHNMKKTIEKQHTRHNFGEEHLYCIYKSCYFFCFCFQT